MNKPAIIREIEAQQLKSDLPSFRVGDTLRIHTRLTEGDKERIQAFTGIVIGRFGSGLSETIALYRVAFGGGIERKFFLHSPRIAKIERISEGQVRKAKLYYLRGAKGKKARVRQKKGVKGAVSSSIEQSVSATASEEMAFSGAQE